MIHGEKAHSCYFSRDAFSRLQGENKELMIIPDAVHTDLYDRMDVIPFDRILSYTGNACEDGSGKRSLQIREVVNNQEENHEKSVFIYGDES